MAETAALKCVRALLDKGADVDMSIEEVPTAPRAAARGSSRPSSCWSRTARRPRVHWLRRAVGLCKTRHQIRMASAEVRVAGKMGSAKCVEILLRACKDEGVEPPRTAALIGAAAHGALDAASRALQGPGRHRNSHHAGYSESGSVRSGTRRGSMNGVIIRGSTLG